MPTVDLNSELQLWNLTLDGVPAIVAGVLQPGITPVESAGYYLVSGVDIDVIWLNRTPTGALNYPVVVQYALIQSNNFALNNGSFTTPFHDLPKGISTSTFVDNGAQAEPSLSYLPNVQPDLFSPFSSIILYDGVVGDVEWVSWTGWTLSYPPEGTGYNPTFPWFAQLGVDGYIFEATGSVLALGISPHLQMWSGSIDFTIAGGTITYPATPPDPLDPPFNIEITNYSTREITWELPPEAEGTTIEWELDGISYREYQDGADLTFLVPGTNSQTIFLTSTVLVPFNLSEPVEYEYVPMGIVIPTGDVSLVIDVAVEAEMAFIGDPSGIYTLVPGQMYDTLYEREAGTTTSQDVPIPRPFGQLTYVPEDE